MKLKVINDFLKEFLNSTDYVSTNYASTIPVYVFNPSNLMSCHSDLLKSYLTKSMIQAVLLDCSSVSDSKTEFFTEIIKGILGEAAAQMKISYDFMEFLSIYNTEIPPTMDIVIIFNNVSQLNLSHLDDFVRLWERKSKDFQVKPSLKFIFDDSVSFLGMESRLRDKFSVKQFACPSVKDIFNELIEEMIRNDLPVLLDPQLMKRFVGLSSSESESINSIIKQIKFLIILNETKRKGDGEGKVINNPLSLSKNSSSSLKDVYLYVSGLAKRLNSVRPSSHLLSPSRDIYPSIFDGVFSDSLAFNEIINELKSSSPNDFVLIMTETEKDDDLLDDKNSHYTLRKFVDLNIITAMKEKINSSNCTNSARTLLKDFQLDLIKRFTDHLREIKIETEMSSSIILKDEKGNVRRSFEADPQFALQVALKYPSVYLNCDDCSRTKTARSSSNLIPSNTPTSSCNSLMSTIHHNRPTMPDTSLLYRLSLEFRSKSINLLAWYKSFLSVIETRKPSSVHTARFFKALNELQLIGMVSEFGRSKRRRKFVDRLNITDTLENE